MEIIILAGGFGTRLRSVISEIPKVLAPIKEKPFLEHMLKNFQNNGITRVIMAVGYKKEYIQEYFGNNYGNMEIAYSIENKPLGTGGAIKKALSLCNEENVIVTNGDVFTEINYKELLEHHKNSQGDISLVIKEMKNFDRYGSVKIKDGRIIEFCEKKKMEKGFMSVGCYVFSKHTLLEFEDDTNFSIEKDFFEKEVNSLYFTPYIYKGQFIDIGIPEDYELAQQVIGNE